MQQTMGAGEGRRRRFVLEIPPAYRLGDLALFFLLALSALTNATTTVQEARGGDVLESLHHLVVALAAAINASLFVLRGPAVARGEGLQPKLVAIVGSWMMPPLTILPITREAGWLLAGTTGAIVLVYAVVIWALLTLRNSFSVFPEARQLVRHGPYGLVRHPLYAAYIVTYIALLLPRFSLPAVLLAGAGIAGEVWRARNEERLLGRVFPEYETYAAATPGFVPAVLMRWRRTSAP